MAKKLIKFAGPDDNDNFKCVSTKGHLAVDPGKLYKRATVSRYFHQSNYDVTIVEPRDDDLSIDLDGRCSFRGLSRKSAK